MKTATIFRSFRRSISTLYLTAFAFALVGVIYPLGSMAKPNTSADATFLDQFSEHHKDAIKMSKLAKSKAHDPELKRMAQKIITEQTEEIDQMASWRRQYFPDQPHAAHGMPKMDMSGLERKSGRAFDRAFIDMMSKHHEQGIGMAKKAEDKLFNPRIKNFAQTTVLKQDQDLSKLARLKKVLPGPKASAE